MTSRHSPCTNRTSTMAGNGPRVETARSMVTRSAGNGSPVLTHYVLWMGGRSVARGQGRINRILGGGLNGDVVGFGDLLVTAALERTGSWGLAQSFDTRVRGGSSSMGPVGAGLDAYSQGQGFEAGWRLAGGWLDLSLAHQCLPTQPSD